MTTIVGSLCAWFFAARDAYMRSIGMCETHGWQLWQTSVIAIYGIIAHGAWFGRCICNPHGTNATSSCLVCRSSWQLVTRWTRLSSKAMTLISWVCTIRSVLAMTSAFEKKKHPTKLLHNVTSSTVIKSKHRKKTTPL
jgi:hypothetical protein